MLPGMKHEILAAGENYRDIDTLIASDPELAREGHGFTGKSMNEVIADPFCLKGSTALARADGATIGFAYAYILPSLHEPWAFVRAGVAQGYRRQGVATALLDHAIGAIRRERPDVHEICFGVWLPNELAAAFGARRGFQAVRKMWKMEIPESRVNDKREPEWPADYEHHVYDGSDRDLKDWNDSYNASFESHYHYVRCSEEKRRELITLPSFRPNGVVLAYRQGRCVGFCHNRAWDDPGDGLGPAAEVAVLGVVPSEQGKGLGRALLRWGVRWQRANGIRRTSLSVDGENENALSLYRSEGFEVTRTRETWAKRV
jgi:mycothiol synthase